MLSPGGYIIPFAVCDHGIAQIIKIALALFSAWKNNVDFKQTSHYKGVSLLPGSGNFIKSVKNLAANKDTIAQWFFDWICRVSYYMDITFTILSRCNAIGRKEGLLLLGFGM